MKIKFYYMQNEEKLFDGNLKEFIKNVNKEGYPSFENEIRSLTIDGENKYFDDVYGLYKYLKE